MKRILFFAFAVVVLASCQKEVDDLIGIAAVVAVVIITLQQTINQYPQIQNGIIYRQILVLRI